MNVSDRCDTGVMALVGATIIDGNGGAPITDGVILIDGKRISAVGDRSTPIPPHARRIPVADKFIIPGFIGNSTVLVGAVTATVPVLYDGRYDELALEAAQVALKSGLTTVVDYWGPRDDLIKVRTAINEGNAIGSRIYLAGNWVGGDGPFSADGNVTAAQTFGANVAARINARWECNVGQVLTSMSPTRVREEIRKYIETGIDFLGVMVNVHRYGAQQFFQFSPRVLTAIVEEAHRAGLVVWGNCMYSEEGVWTAVNAGVDVPQVAYMSTPLSAETLELLAKRQIPMTISPFTRQELEWYRRRPNPQDDEWNKANKSMPEAKPLNEQALLRAGVPLMFCMGGYLMSAESQNHPLRKDRSPPGDARTLGNTHFTDLLGAQDMGMKPMDALQAATRNIARGYKVDKDLGTLERGKFADLLVLDRNPLENAENYRSISVVMKEGQVIDRDALPSRRLLTAPSVGSSQ